MDLSKNFFQIFNLPEAYDVDLSVVTEIYRELQKNLHPDKFVNATDKEKLFSVQLTSYVNEALETLKSPLKRGLYLMKLWGREVDLEKNTAMSPDFLMTQMELREELEAIPKKTDPEDAYDAFMEHLQKEIKLLQTQFANCLVSSEQADLEKGEELARKLTFLEKLDEEAQKVESQIFD